MYDRLTFKELTALVGKKRTQADAAEDPYRHLFDHCDAILLVIHPGNGAIILANRAACRYFGYDSTHITTMTAHELGIIAWNDILEEMEHIDRDRRHVVKFQHRRSNGITASSGTTFSIFLPADITAAAREISDFQTMVLAALLHIKG